MSLNKFQKLIISSVGVTLLAFVFQVFAISETINVNQEVIGVCNHNGICEPALGENSENCPLDCPLPTPPSPPGIGPIQDIKPPVIYNVLISKITLNSAEISWNTDEPALCQLFWGKTQEYKEGSISEITFSLFHKTELINLLPDTNYHFKIKCRDPSGNESETVDQKFVTLRPPDITPPTNVSDFEAIPGDSQITLKWRNPPDPDFKGVRIMRSTKFYPREPWEGELVYESKKTSFVDTGLINGQRYYYTAFSYDYAGNYSSGAIASAVPFRAEFPPEKITTEKECLEAGFYWYDNACHREPKVVPLPPEVEKIIVEKFDFIQRGVKLPIEEGRVRVVPNEPLTVSIDYEKVPKLFKTMKVTIEKNGKFFSFFLRINKEKTAYLVTFMPPEPGVYPLTITILDHKDQLLKKIPYQLIVSGILPPPLPISWYEKYRCYIDGCLICLLIGIIIGLGIGYLIWKKRKKKELKEEEEIKKKFKRAGLEEI